jgi:hypothetical protein
MNLTPYDYYCMTWYEYNLKCEGFVKAKELDQHLLRRVAYIVHCSMVSKPLSPEKLWPIGDEAKDKDKISPSLMKKLAAFKAKEKLKENG